MYVSYKGFGQMWSPWDSVLICFLATLALCGGQLDPSLDWTESLVSLQPGLVLLRYITCLLTNHLSLLSCLGSSCSLPIHSILVPAIDISYLSHFHAVSLCFRHLYPLFFGTHRAQADLKLHLYLKYPVLA